jgi:hypothetical protein
MTNEFAGAPVLANAFSPDVLADEALGFEMINGTVRITLASAKMTDGAPPSDVQLVVIGRLVMGPESAHRLAVGLFDYLKKHGIGDAALGVEDQKPN